MLSNIKKSDNRLKSDGQALAILFFAYSRAFAWKFLKAFGSTWREPPKDGKEPSEKRLIDYTNRISSMCYRAYQWIDSNQPAPKAELALFQELPYANHEIAYTFCIKVAKLDRNTDINDLRAFIQSVLVDAAQVFFTEFPQAVNEQAPGM